MNKYSQILLVTLCTARLFASSDISPYYEANLSEIERSATDTKNAVTTPSWANWDLADFSLKIKKTVLGSKTYLFGILCSGGDKCNTGAPEMAPQFVRLVRRDNQILLLASESKEGIVLKPLARWLISNEDNSFVYASPDLSQGLSLVFDSFDKGVKQRQDLKVYDRFFHDFRTENDALWFHETIRYQYQLDLSFLKDLIGTHFATLDFSKLEKPQDKADTFTLYLIPDPFDPKFTVKEPIPNIGFFINVPVMEDNLIYTQKEPFNAAKNKAIRWTSGKEIEWIVESSAPNDIYQLIKEGVLEWNKYLTSVKLKVRRAEEKEELDSPYKNIISYSASDNTGGVTYFSFHPTTGEIFHSAIAISAPKKLSNGTAVNVPSLSNTILSKIRLQYNDHSAWGTADDFASPFGKAEPLTKEQTSDSIRGVTAHEVGHSLGLRHNFEGSLYADDLKNLPGGASVMEYPHHFYDMRIGPYDVEAVEWGYENKNPTGKYRFCSDEATGDMFGMLTPAYDPECQRYDHTLKDPFAFYYDKVMDVIQNQLSKGVLKEDGVVIGQKLAFIMPHLRSSTQKYYDKEKFSKVYDLFRLFSKQSIPDTKEARQVYWNVADALLRSLGNEVKEYWPLDQVYQNPIPLNEYLNWIAMNAGRESDNFSKRKKAVSSILKWRDEVYGSPFIQRLENQLRAYMNVSTDETLRLENQSLLRLF